MQTELRTKMVQPDFIIMHMEIGDHVEQIVLLVTDRNKSDIFIGHDWIHHHNSEIDWRKETIEFTGCPLECNMELHEDHNIKPTDEELIPDDLNIHANVSTQLAIDQEKLKPKRTIDKQLPQWLKDFKDVFEPSYFNELPSHQSWDHAIDLTPDAPAYTKHKLYSMSPNEQIALDEFIDENLKTGRIRPSNSSYTTPSSFRTRKMENYTLDKIIVNSIPIPYEIVILSLSFLISSINLKEQSISLKWT